MVEMPSFLEVAEPGCAVEDMDDEIVALNLATGCYFSMRGCAASLWRDLAAGTRVDVLRNLFDQPATPEGGFDKFVEALLSDGLMRPRRDVGADRHSLSVATCLDQGDHILILEKFDDMQDLILSDPIHDVDANVGWPRQPQSE
ncbi:hypothetical protein TPR58_02655 [Sphingomonas sp. HF-S3]|uniref:PqqD family protein n=1 Tax=Sphingomonas rustica TaxID=3103142 RepID=A0ABV0B390_9SPHN